MSHKTFFLVLAGASAVLLALAFTGCGHNDASTSQPSVSGPEAGQETFTSPDQACQTLIDALRSNDDARLKSILGPSADQITSSGDEVADQQNRQKFLDLYDAKHELITADDGSQTLDVGSDDWPMPVPLVKDDHGAWYFDTPSGLDEILNRRIGKNELSAIQVCLAVVDAQRDYVKRNPDGDNLPEYAQKIVSDPGKKNGLYWPTDENEQASPLGPLMATATEEGYPYPPPASSPGPHPYHGYYYRLLTSQGANASGGAMDYMVDGKLIGGFALVAYPAQYGNSGIMTFIVNYEGTIYQKDLGDNTDSIAKAMTSFDPDSTWTIVQPADRQIIGQ
jgi:hypothetical protein